ncbi:hypothetical protein F2Q70_00017634 [Brassica cretica]|uniref:Uncharacterized protein n=1 Tax=Brassica cretica TaxID=69181 RepID=A0A8S9HPW1_BRACR|nr:hypothetical protein F2Q70_00017634 [Brassica cretica]KAF2596408.1 hypothetical protein F2Q68_00010565 [Brassica cretica]
MDSPVSRSDSSSEPGEGSNCDLMAPLPLSYVNAAPPLVGPASSVGEDELAEWRGRYSLPYSVILRVPTPKERASSYISGEISVYEAFFDSSLRGTIPALIVGLCNLFEISPSKLNPPAWRILIAIENLGDLEYLSLGINEFLFAYHLAPLNGGEGRFHLRPRSGLPIVEELRKSDWKGLVFNKKWQERYAFMIRKSSCSCGRRESCSPSMTASCRSSPCELLGDMSGGVTSDPFAAYQEAAKMIGKAGAFSISSRKETQSGGVTTRSAQQSADMARSAGSLAVALSNLNLNVFPQEGTVLPIGDPSEVVQVFQGGLLRLHHIGERLSSEDLPTLREEIEDLKRQVSGERDQCAARELEVRDLKDKVKDLEKVAEVSSADAFTTSQKNQEMEEEIDVGIKIHTVD